MARIKLDVESVNYEKFSKQMVVNMRRKVIREANKIWAEGIESFTNVTSRLVRIDTGMSAYSLLQPALETNLEETLSNKLRTSSANKAIAHINQNIKHSRAKPLKNLSGETLKGRYRTYKSALKDMQRNTEVKYLSLTAVVGDGLVFKYSISAWQLGGPSDTTIEAGFRAFEETVEEGFSKLESRIDFGDDINAFAFKELRKIDK